MSCYDDLKKRMDIEILRGMNAIINCVDSKTNEQMIRKNILKDRLMMANYAALFNNISTVNHGNLQPWQIAILNSTACRLPSDDPNKILFKMENREKLKKVLREDLMNERKR